MTTPKERKPINSLNLWTTIITILISAIFTSQGTEVDFSAEQIATLITSEKGIALASSLFLLLFTPIYKTFQRIAKDGYNWEALKSKNLLAHIVSLLAIVLGIWLGADQVGFVIAGLTQVVNYVSHRFQFAK